MITIHARPRQTYIDTDEQTDDSRDDSFQRTHRDLKIDLPN